MMRYVKLITAILAVMAGSGCDSDNTMPIDSIGTGGQRDAWIDNVPLMADSFVMSAFAMDAIGDPLDIDNVVLQIED